MKKLFVFLMMLSATSVIAQSPKFVAAMERNLAQMDTVSTAPSMLHIANQFERISLAEPKEWLPGYYIAWLNVMMTFQETDNIKKDAMLDKALDLISKADVLSPDNSEIYAMKSFALSMKIGIDPATRGQQLGMESGISLARAMKLDPENPRVYLLKGQSAMYTPAQYGGGKDVALPLLEQAVEKFKTFKPKSTIMPKWGSKRADEVLVQCKNMD